jgi:hypothetical protein
VRPTAKIKHRVCEISCSHGDESSGMLCRVVKRLLLLNIKIIYFLPNCSEQRPSNKDGREGWESGSYGNGPASDLIFVPQYVIVVRLCFKRHILYIHP